MNFQNSGKASFSGPYQWKNLNDRSCTWDNGYHLWWDMTATTGDTPAFFQFSQIVPDSYLKIVDANGVTGTEYFDFSVTTLGDAVDILNVSTDSVINKYVYNLVMNAASSQIFVQAVSRYYGRFGDFKSVDMVNVDGDRICESGTGVTSSTGGCLSRIYKSSQSISNNPTWNTALFINDGKVLPPMTWAMFVYDKCRIKTQESI